MIQLLKRLIGDYKTIKIDCKYDKNEYLELTKYPDGEILISVRVKGIESDEDPTMCLTKEDLEKLVEELKE